MALFDAAIKLDQLPLPLGPGRHVAMLKVEAAVRAIGRGPGSVDWLDRPVAGGRRVSIRQVDGLFALDEAACLRIATDVEAELRRALFSLARAGFGVTFGDVGSRGLREYLIVDTHR